MIRILFILLCSLLTLPAWTQQQENTIQGKVTGQNNQPITNAVVRLENSNTNTQTGSNGTFRLKMPAPGNYILLVSAVGYTTQEKQVTVQPGNPANIQITLSPVAYQGKEVEVKQATAAKQTKQQAFAVDVVDLKTLRSRNNDMNRLLDALPGIRVRETGGVGSSFQYTIHGLSGKAVRLFLNGVPMESYGSSFNVNNLPPNAIDRLEIYKGVTPVHLGTDALGGAINIITRNDIRNYLDITYTYGSYQTHKTSLSGFYRQPRTGFTLTGFLGQSYSANNYQVWGPTAEVADEYGRSTGTNIRYKRFNDDYNNLNGRVETGFSNTRWADQLMLGVSVAGLKQGIQTGRTMAFVYGDVRYNETYIMPSLRYVKKNLFNNKLKIDAYIALNHTAGTTIDTGSNKYNWAGKVIANVTGELDGIRAQRSRYTFTDNTILTVLNTSYQLRPTQTIHLNYTVNNTRRQGKDDIALAEWTIPFREPQQINKHVAGLSYEIATLDQKWTNMFFIKNFRYNMQANTYDYNGTANKEVKTIHSNDNSWGFGYGTRLLAGNNTLIKLSAENTTRMPDATELLGNGNTILNAPGLKAEHSLNLNTNIQKTITTKTTNLTLEAGFFFRNVKNLIWLGESGIRGSAQYENIQNIRSAGTEIAVRYNYKKWLELSANGTWQDVRNKQRYTPAGATNNTFNSKMKNMPSLMWNAEISVRYPDFLKKGTQLSAYLNTHYVERYFLQWPSLGDRSDKKVIPEQFVQDAGITYSFLNSNCSITVECRNILDKQVYDNYLLQKPGRFNSITVRYFLHHKTNQ